MHSLNTSNGLDFFIPIVSKRAKELGEEGDDLTKRADTPDLFLKSTGKNRGILNRSVFNFSYADITQMMPDMKGEVEVPKEAQQSTREELKTEEKKEIVEKSDKPNANDRISKKTKLLEKVCQTLELVLTDKKLEAEVFDMPEKELAIVKCVIAKKYATKDLESRLGEIARVRAGDIPMIVSELRQSYQTKKRKEEKIKFVFKHTINSMKKKFFEDQNLQFTSENEPKFFQHYFMNAFNSKGTPVEHFYDPLNTSYITNPSFKTLSKDYLILLFEYETFHKDFWHLINNKILESYKSKVYKKFKKLFKKLRKRIRTMGLGKMNDVIEEFISKFAQNKRCKLPWTPNEILDAITCFKDHVNSLVGNFKE